MSRSKREYIIVDVQTKEEIAKDVRPVMGSRINAEAARIRCGWANLDVGYKKYKIIRGELI